MLGPLLVSGAALLGVYAIVTSERHGWGSAHTLGLGGLALGLAARRGSRTRWCRRASCGCPA